MKSQQKVLEARARLKEVLMVDFSEEIAEVLIKMLEDYAQEYHKRRGGKDEDS